MYNVFQRERERGREREREGGRERKRERERGREIDSRFLFYGTCPCLCIKMSYTLSIIYNNGLQIRIPDDD